MLVSHAWVFSCTDTHELDLAQRMPQTKMKRSQDYAAGHPCAILNWHVKPITHLIMMTP